ncbi:MAG: PBP1A family penicillin-binding protein [Gemmatimonadetes bacterium]|nr:PBP1A family penicillin-binding protein [Gemmatimonadota bacterium]
MKRKRTSRRKLFTRRRLAFLALAVVSSGLAFVVFEARVAAAFESVERAAPTRIVARPLILRLGDRPSRADVSKHLTDVGYRSVRRGTPEIGEFRLSGRDWRIGRRPIRLGSYFDAGGPVRVRLDRRGRVRAIAAGERDLPGILLDPEQIGTVVGPDGRDRVNVSLDQLPGHLIEALLTVEDRSFYEHGAFDPRRMVGAALANLRQRRLAQGGSTLTQQLARTLFLSNERTVFRKLREAAIAVALERRFSKDRLLEAYLNHIYLGQNGGDAIHGVGRAAQFFFGCDASRLTLGQSAMLVGIIRGPSVYSPHRQPERAEARRDLVLRQLHEQGYIDADRLASETESSTSIQPRRTRPRGARWYMDLVRRELATGPGFERLDGAGLTVVTALEPEMQRAAASVIRDGLANLERRRPALVSDERTLQAALVAIDPWSGEIVAMVGGRSYGASQFNRAVDARRQPGSAFKPIVALAALQPVQQNEFTLASLIADEPLSVETPQGAWRPANADREFLGPIPLREALEASRNVPFARLGMAIGPERIVETARDLGIESRLTAVPSLALGASEVSLLELTSAYAALAAEGERVEPHAVRAVLDPAGESLHDATPRSRHAATPAEAYLLTSALRGVVERGTGRAVRDLGYEGPVAAKSGTTNGSRDAWFVGYTPELAVGVWVGFDDGTPIGFSGSQAALPIFTSFLKSALGEDGDRDFRFPDGIEMVDVEPETGLRAGWRCHGEPELFLAGTVPEYGCGRTDRLWREYRRGRYDSDVMEDVERWLRRSLGSRRPARVESDLRRRSGREPGP